MFSFLQNSHCCTVKIVLGAYPNLKWQSWKLKKKNNNNLERNKKFFVKSQKQNNFQGFVLMLRNLKYMMWHVIILARNALRVRVVGRVENVRSTFYFPADLSEKNFLTLGL